MGESPTRLLALARPDAGSVVVAERWKPATRRRYPRRMPTARGQFTVTLTPQDDPAGSLADAFARFLIVKRFQGDLVGTSRAQMLSYRCAEPSSAGYVALEVVDAELAGRRGRFVFLHRGVMDRGTPTLDLSIVPDSGTDGLSGISGALRILIRDGRHDYEFDYELPSP